MKTAFLFILTILGIFISLKLQAELSLEIQPRNYQILSNTSKLNKSQTLSLTWKSLNDSSIKYLGNFCASCESDAVQFYAHNAEYKIEIKTGTKILYQSLLTRKDIFEKYLRIGHFEYEPSLPEKLTYNPTTGNLSLTFKFASGISDVAASLVILLDKKGKVIQAIPHYKDFGCGTNPFVFGKANCLTCRGVYSLMDGKQFIDFGKSPIQETYSLNDTLFLVVKDKLYTSIVGYQENKDSMKLPFQPTVDDSNNIYLYGKSGLYVEQRGKAVIRKSSTYLNSGQIIPSLKLVGFYDRYNETLFLYSGKNPLKKLSLPIAKIKQLKIKPQNAKVMGFIGRGSVLSFYYDLNGNLLGYMPMNN